MRAELGADSGKRPDRNCLGWLENISYTQKPAPAAPPWGASPGHPGLLTFSSNWRLVGAGQKVKSARVRNSRVFHRASHDGPLVYAPVSGYCPETDGFRTAHAGRCLSWLQLLLPLPSFYKFFPPFTCSFQHLFIQQTPLKVTISPSTVL